MNDSRINTRLSYVGTHAACAKFQFDPFVTRLVLYGKLGWSNGWNTRCWSPGVDISTNDTRTFHGLLWNDEADYKEWHEAILKWLPKKGDLPSVLETP
eukprot:scaffold81625_cov72-Attheya_sp.AAC.1